MLELIFAELLIKKFITYPFYIVTRKTVGRVKSSNTSNFIQHVQRSMVEMVIYYSIIAVSVVVVVDEFPIYVLCFFRVRVRVLRKVSGLRFIE